MIKINDIIICIGLVLIGVGLLGPILYTMFSNIEKTYNRITFTMIFFLVILIFSIILIFVGCFI